MSRWHHKSCETPDVYLGATSIPQCRSCGASSSDLMREMTAKSLHPFPAMPPDEPADKMNLRWPYTVPYKRRGCDVQSNPSQQFCDSSREVGETDMKSLSIASTTIVPPKHSPIYDKMLDSNEFRLVYLSAVEQHGSNAHADILHLTLETYSHDKAPEYEAVSYTWGGEDGDSSLTHPIYVNEFWDILLQTKNCHAMLRFLRPWRGVRMLWVDAICINQNNVEERSDQVAQMGRIYSGCSRVAVWLGEDVAAPNTPGAHPHHRRLAELQRVPPPNRAQPVATTTGGGRGGVRSEQRRIARKPLPAAPARLDIDRLLKRRYFSRVWVIQELVLAPRAIIPIGDTIYWVDPAMPRDVAAAAPPSWDWDQTAAPWVQHASQGSLPAQSLSQLISLTGRCQAADVRDRLFAVLGLFRSRGRGGVVAGTESLKPDYSLSGQHLYTGFFAYCILNQREVHLLYASRGLTADVSAEAGGGGKTEIGAGSGGGGGPTWVPDWRRQSTWEWMFQDPDEECESSDEDSLDGLFWGDNVWDDIARIITTKPRAAARLHLGGMAKFYHFEEFEADEEPVYRSVFSRRPWHQDASIDADTGALSIHLTRLVRLDSGATRIGESGRLSLYQIVQPQRNAGEGPGYYGVPASPRPHHSVYLASLHRSLPVRPGDELYLLNPAEGAKAHIYLILRRSSSNSSSSMPLSGYYYKLVATCLYVYFVRDGGSWSTTCLQIRTLQTSLHTYLGWLSERLGGDMYSTDLGLLDTYATRQVFPGAHEKTLGSLLPLLLHVSDPRRGGGARHGPSSASSSSQFAQLYVATVDGRYSPAPAGDWLVLAMIPYDWKAVQDDYMTEFPSIEWRWTREGGGKTQWRSLAEDKPSAVALWGPKRIVICCRLQEVYRHVRGLAETLGLDALFRSGLLGATSEEIAAKIKAGPAEEHHFIPRPGRRLPVYDELRMDGTTMQVQIF